MRTTRLGYQRQQDAGRKLKMGLLSMTSMPTGGMADRPQTGRTSIADQMRASGNRSSGFDYLRVLLAASIILWHGLPTCYGSAVEIGFWRGPFGVLMHFVLPMFFALSGFLVAGSLDRCPTLVSFFGLRILRILPALGVEILLSALIFGPLLTRVNLAEYFSSPVFAAYFLNLVGDIHFRLPGLFAGNPLPNIVNGQLWTIPYELQCYIALGTLAIIGLAKRPGLLILVVAAGQAMWAYEAIRHGDNGSSNGASGQILVLSFLAGLLVHRYREVIPFSQRVFWPVLGLGLLLSGLPHGAYYLPLPAAYLTVFLGLLNPRKLGIVSSGDYSYGLFLYGYPLQQAIASIGPGVQHWWINAGLALPLAGLIAYISWHTVEKRALALRRHLPAIEARALAWVAGTETFTTPALRRKASR